MNEADAIARPALSAVTVAGPLRERAARTLAGLASQSAVAEIECVLVDTAPEAAQPLRIPPGLEVNYLRRPEADRGEDRAEGVRHARAPVVALIEDHAVPRPDWARALIAAHRQPWGAVGYAFAVPEPSNRVSRAALVTEHGSFMHPASSGPAPILPGTNVSYKREVLERMAGDLPRFFAHEHVLHGQLARLGFRMWLESGAVVEHEYFRQVRPLLAVNYAHGRIIAAARARTWSRSRRLSWALATPVGAPLVRAWRLIRAVGRHPRSWRRVLAAVPLIPLTYAAEALGESLGYLLGVGAAKDRVAELELRVPRLDAARRRRAPATLARMAPSRLVVATRNERKLRELAEILAGIELAPLPAGVELPPEEGETFAANALAKARAAHRATGEPAIADDSGIEARALGGLPGVRSARFAGPDAGDEENLDLLLRRLEGAGDRGAAYVCALACVGVDGEEILVEGRCEGELAAEPRGSAGFGYDPAFVPDDTGAGDGRTMAELSAAEKHAISHRGRAARALAERLGVGEAVR